MTSFVHTVSFYMRYAVRALWRGGQRTLLALVCIGFGVMSLVSMQLLSSNFAAVVMNDPRAELNGDVSLSRAGLPVQPEHLEQVEALHTAGVIQAYTRFADGGPQIMRVHAASSDAGADRIYMLQSALGVETTTFPLVGTVLMREPLGVTLTDVLRAEGSAAITRDIADELNINVGDTIALIARAGSTPVQLHVTGIVQAMPDRRGDVVLYSLRTAPLVNGWPDVVTRISAVWQSGLSAAQQAATLEQLKQGGWRVRTTADVLNDSSRSQVAGLFGFMFKGAGILGLIVGGIGVATTLRVLLARRTLEIAMLKTLGYQQRDLVMLFALEAFVLGVLGSLGGIVVALLLSRQLTELLTRTGVMLVDWFADPAIVVGGVLVGVATAVVFGLQPIIISSAVRPVALLRQLTTPAGRHSWRTRLGSATLYLLLAVLFTALCSLIMGTLLEGAIIVGVAVAGLLVLGLLLAAALSLAVRVPLPGLRMATLARNSLRRQILRLIFPMLALFAGVFTIAFAAVIMISANHRLVDRRLSDTGDNLVVYARHTEEAAVREQLAQQGLLVTRASYLATVQLRMAGDIPVAGVDTLEGRSAAEVAANVTLSGEAWSEDGNAIYLPGSYADKLSQGSTFTLVTADRQAHAVRLAGFYTPKAGSVVASMSYGVLANQKLARTVGGDSMALALLAAVPPPRLVDVSTALRQALPQATILSVLDLDEFVNRTMQNLFAFVVAVAALALLAGAVLIANAVGLSILERQRELGIYKAVGFSSHDVLKMVLIEHSLLGLLGGLAGIAGVAVAVAVINQTQPNAQLSMQPLFALLMLAVSVLIAGGIAAAVAWRPTHIRPLQVLRTE